MATREPGRANRRPEPLGFSRGEAQASVRRLVLGLSQLWIPGRNMALWNRGNGVGSDRAAQVV